MNTRNISTIIKFFEKCGIIPPNCGIISTSPKILKFYESQIFFFNWNVFKFLPALLHFLLMVVIKQFILFLNSILNSSSIVVHLSPIISRIYKIFVSKHSLKFVTFIFLFLNISKTFWFFNKILLPKQSKIHNMLNVLFKLIYFYGLFFLFWNSFVLHLIFLQFMYKYNV
jgi:hypothetical protein